MSFFRVVGSVTRLPPLVILVLLLGPGALPGAQETAVVRVEENLRAEPNGQIIGQALPGTRLQVEGRQDRWIEVTFEGFVWLPSLQGRSGGAFDLAVGPAEGENLRDEPRGRISARLGRGTLLEEVERTTGWARVRRTAWIWGPSVTVEVRSAPVSTPAAVTPPAAESRWIRGGRSGSPVLSSPDGDTLARSAPGAELRMTGREGNWVRVQIDGWIWSPEGSDSLEGTDVVSRATPEEVAADAAGFRGRLVSWTLQYIATERAERVRTDFYEGEPYLLTRSGTGEGSFVYVAVPPERAADVSGLTPLERVTVVGRVRTGSADLTGGPILDLVEIRRVGR